MRIEKSECNYQVTECDLKFGGQITLDGELLIPISVLDKIRAEIEQEYNCLSAARADETLELGECLGLKMALKIIDKYREKRSDKE